MHPGLLDVLHHAADRHVLAVAHGVHVDLDRVLEELVDEDGMVGRDLHRLGHVPHEVLVVVDDLHGPAAQHVRGADEHRVADGAGDGLRLGERADGGAGRLAQAELADERVEALAVLGAIDGVGRRAQDGHAGLAQRHRQLERRLSAELDDDAERLLLLHDVEDVFQGQRLEVQTVGGVVVGRDRLGVAVDHDRFHAQLAEREGGVHAAVVELDALADPVRARAEDDDLPRGRRPAPRPPPRTSSRDTACGPRTRRRRCPPS